jgi:hypothetical protein
MSISEVPMNVINDKFKKNFLLAVQSMVGASKVDICD